MRKPRASVILGEFQQNDWLGSFTCDCSNQVRVDEEAQSLSHSGRVQNDFQSKTGCCLLSVNSDERPYCIEVESTTEIMKRERTVNSK